MITKRLKSALSTLGRVALRPFKASGTYNPADWFIDWFHQGRESDSGIVIASEKSALAYSWVWQAVNMIAGDVGALDLNLYQRTDAGGKDLAVDHPAQPLLRARPNGLMNAGVFKELITAHALLRGDGRAGIRRDRRGNPIELIPFLPDRSHEETIAGKLVHLTRLGSGQDFTPFADEDVLHIKGLGFNGINGYSVIELARNSWGLGLAAEKHGNRHFRNGAQPGVILEAPGGFDEGTAQSILKDWNRMHAGISNVGRTGLLSKGMTAKVLNISNQDAEWLATRAFAREEVLGWFLIPPSRGGIPNTTGYGSLELEEKRYISFCLRRWLRKWTEECHEKLLTEKQKEDDSHFFAFNLADLLEADQKSRFAAYQIGIQCEFLSPDDVRRMEGLGDRPDGAGGEYKNPNVKSHKQGDRDLETGTAADDGTRETVVNQLRRLLTVEQHRVETAAAKSKDFAAWADGFYSRWVATLETLVVSLGGEPWDAAEHIGESRRQLAALETITLESVKALVAEWPERARLLADAIEKTSKATA